MNEAPPMGPERVQFGKQTRFNPIRNLRPEMLAWMLDQFQYGYLRQTALLWDTMERRDDVLKCVAPKRKKAVARRTWEILKLDDSPDAQKHYDALEYFYNNLTATDATDRNVRGGFSLLVRQMMDAAGKFYAVHNIVWKPAPEGMTADLFFVPLWYFENLTGELRFLLQDFDATGVPLEPGSWMVTFGDGLMEACSVAYMFKHLPLRDWLIYSQRFGSAGIQARTDSPKDSKEWNETVEAVTTFGQGWTAVTDKLTEFVKIDMSTTGELPQPKLVERMDRTMSALWRGADLSTMSAGAGRGQGASIQGDESDLLEVDDCGLITETLNAQIDTWVIKYQFGTDRPLAYIRIVPPEQKNISQDLEVDTFCLDAGVPLAADDVYKRYNRRKPAAGEVLLEKPATPVITPPAIPALNERQVTMPKGQTEFLDSSVDRLVAVGALALQPVVDRVAKIDATQYPDVAALNADVKRLMDDLPDLARQAGGNAEQLAAWESVLTNAVANGLTSNPQTK